MEELDMNEPTHTHTSGLGAIGHELPTTMRAASRLAYGSAAAVVVDTVPRPEPGAGEVLVKVAAAGLDRATLHLLEGKPYVARAALGLRRPRRTILGQQVAGEVVAVGAGVAGLAVGDRVFGTAAGSYAEYAVAKASTLARTPDGLTDEEAATLGVSGITAHEAVVGQGKVRPGQHVLVLGASGAVGTYAVQLATHLGAHVTGVCSATKLDFVRSLGAERAFDYRSSSLAEMGPDVDVIIDIAGNLRLRELRTALTHDGVLVIVGGEGGGPFLGGIQRNLLAALWNPLTRQRLQWFVSTPTTERCSQLAEFLVAAGIHPPVDRRVGLEGVRGGIEAMHDGQLRGHVIVRP
jgi:NADPH:quinone reductase-like Zn-dependent oxidoreductase